MTREEIDMLDGRRARVTRADGAVFVGRIQLDSVARFFVIGSKFGHGLRYDHIIAIALVDDSVPDTE